MANNNEEILALRKQIDAVDASIQDLLNQRAALALQIGQIKRRHETSPVFYHPERETDILRQVCERNAGLLDNDALKIIFNTIIKSCLNLQEKIKVAFLGPVGTYSHAAMNQYFGGSIPYMATSSIAEIFSYVTENKVMYGVVPIENSTTGMIQVSVDLLAKSPVTICDEIKLPIHHCLLANKKPNTPQRIYAHEQAFLQCEQWLATHHPRLEKIVVASNGAGAEKALSDLESFAIASEQAAEIYGLQIMVKNIEDKPDNQTRFIIIRKS